MLPNLAFAESSRKLHNRISFFDLYPFLRGLNTFRWNYLQGIQSNLCLSTLWPLHWFIPPPPPTSASNYHRYHLHSPTIKLHYKSFTFTLSDTPPPLLHFQLISPSILFPLIRKNSTFVPHIFPLNPCHHNPYPFHPLFPLLFLSLLKFFSSPFWRIPLTPLTISLHPIYPSPKPLFITILSTFHPFLTTYTSPTFCVFKYKFMKKI